MNLLSGHFDLAFVIVFVLPLLVTTLGYNLLSAEREHGTLRMLCSQPLSIATLMTGKVVVRMLALLAIVIPVPLVVLLLIRPEARGAEQLVLMLSWSALVAAYSLFWFAVAALVNTVGRSSSTNALIMVALWTIFVLILPVTMNLAVGLVSPAPPAPNWPAARVSQPPNHCANTRTSIVRIIAMPPIRKHCW
ncbi:ABC transporter permease [Bradyrhizobium sp. RDT10]